MPYSRSVMIYKHPLNHLICLKRAIFLLRFSWDRGESMKFWWIKLFLYRIRLDVVIRRHFALKGAVKVSVWLEQDMDIKSKKKNLFSYLLTCQMFGKVHPSYLEEREYLADRNLSLLKLNYSYNQTARNSINLRMINCTILFHEEKNIWCVLS